MEKVSQGIKSLEQTQLVYENTRIDFTMLPNSTRIAVLREYINVGKPILDEGLCCDKSCSSGADDQDRFMGVPCRLRGRQRVQRIILVGIVHGMAAGHGARGRHGKEN